MGVQLRIAVCLWHSFNWPGSDVFGVGTFDRPWLTAGVDVATASRAKLDAAFEFIDKLNVPFFTFHDRGVAPEGRTYAETQANLDDSVDQLGPHMAPKPQEPTKHPYDYAVAAVVGFLQRPDLASEYRLNLEANHATLAGHSFHHEVASAIALGAFGSIAVNRGDYQNCWDTDQFPNSVDELSLALHEILGAGGLTTGGFNFDAKLRPQSLI